MSAEYENEGGECDIANTMNQEELTHAVGELLGVCENCKLYPALITILSRILAILQEENSLTHVN
jgi:hypothetical protein